MSSEEGVDIRKHEREVTTVELIARIDGLVEAVDGLAKNMVNYTKDVADTLRWRKRFSILVTLAFLAVALFLGGLGFLFFDNRETREEAAFQSCESTNNSRQALRGLFDYFAYTQQQAGNDPFADPFFTNLYIFAQEQYQEIDCEANPVPPVINTPAPELPAPDTEDIPSTTTTTPN